MAQIGHDTPQAPLSRAAMGIITHDTVAPPLSWSEVTETPHRGHTQARPDLSNLLPGAQDALPLNRAACIAGPGCAVKVETVVPGNAERGLPTVQGPVILHDPDDGSVRAVIDSRLVTIYETAVDPVLFAQLLARPDSEHLLIAGAGPVAACLARGYTAIFPRPERVSEGARCPERGKTLIDSPTDVGADPSVAMDPGSAARTADIVVSATSARGPIIVGECIPPGTDVDLVGTLTPDMREADDALMTGAHGDVHLRRITIDVTGELIQPIAAGAISRDDVRGHPSDLIASAAPARTTKSDTTLFQDGGGAHLDPMVANHIVEFLAERRGSCS